MRRIINNIRIYFFRFINVIYQFMNKKTAVKHNNSFVSYVFNSQFFFFCQWIIFVCTKTTFRRKKFAINKFIFKFCLIICYRNVDFIIFQQIQRINTSSFNNIKIYIWKIFLKSPSMCGRKIVPI